MKTTKTRAYQKALENAGVPKNLARNAAVVLRADEFKVPRTERGQRIIEELFTQHPKTLFMISKIRRVLFSS